jgi:hypothetical protein
MAPPGSPARPLNANSGLRSPLLCAFGPSRPRPSSHLVREADIEQKPSGLLRSPPPEHLTELLLRGVAELRPRRPLMMRITKDVDQGTADGNVPRPTIRHFWPLDCDSRWLITRRLASPATNTESGPDARGYVGAAEKFARSRFTGTDPAAKWRRRHAGLPACRPRSAC